MCEPYGDCSVVAESGPEESINCYLILASGMLEIVLAIGLRKYKVIRDKALEKKSPGVQCLGVELGECCTNFSYKTDFVYTPPSRTLLPSRNS